MNGKISESSVVQSQSRDCFVLERENCFFIGLELWEPVHLNPRCNTESILKHVSKRLENHEQDPNKPISVNQVCQRITNKLVS